MKSWTPGRGAIRSTPVHPHPVSVVEPRDENGACMGKGQTRPDQEGKAFGVKSTPPSRAGRDTSGIKMALVAFFSLLQMGANNSSLTPLNCILKNWDKFDPQGLNKTHLVFLCDTTWPQYPLEDGEWWPVGGSLKYNTVLQLD